MSQTIATIALVVADYDDAIAFYRDRVGFSVLEDADMGAANDGFFWPPGADRAQGSCSPRRMDRTR